MSNGMKNKCIIYCKTKADTEHISSKLKDLGISSYYFSHMQGFYLLNLEIRYKMILNRIRLM